MRLAVVRVSNQAAKTDVTGGFVALAQHSKPVGTVG
jgi:hypothetical protein